MKGLGIFGSFVAVSALLLVLASKSNTPPVTPAPAPTPDAELMAMQAETKRLEEAERGKQEAWKKEKTAILMFVVAVKRSMKNPDSFKLEQALLMDDRSVCVSYRATNSFNAVVPGHAVRTASGKVAAEGQDGFRGLWSKFCNNKTGTDLRLLPQEITIIEAAMR